MKPVSCLIPLYRSRRFLEIVQANIDAHLELDAEVILSDRHLLDDTTAVLVERYHHVPNVHIITATDAADWVENTNSLIARSTGKYFRIVPHDDTATAESTRLLMEALERNDDAVLAYGVVRAIDLEGQAIPGRDEMNANDSPENRAWSIEDALSLFWRARFLGSFKGLVRGETLRKNNLQIKKTPTLIHSERTWLFGLALAGRFQFVPDSVLLKRYHETSTHRGWRYSAQVILDAAATMQGYCDDLIADPQARRRAVFNLLANAHREAHWFDNRHNPRPAYLTGSQTEKLLQATI